MAITIRLFFHNYLLKSWLNKMISLDIDFNSKKMIIKDRSVTSNDILKFFNLIDDFDGWNIIFNFNKGENQIG